MSGAIELYARKTAGFDERLARTVAVLEGAGTEHGGRIVQATSLGGEDMVLTDLIARRQLPIAVATLATGKLHAQTLALIPRIEQRYDIKVERFEPEPLAIVRFVAHHGERAMFESIELRKACCQVRKLEPLGRMLKGREAWVTGLRREQSQARGEVRASEADDQGRTKFNPLADWSWNDVWHYIASHHVPYNELHDQFFQTLMQAVGHDFKMHE